MKMKLAILVLACAVAAFAQGRGAHGGGAPMGPPAGNAGGMGHGNTGPDMGRAGDMHTGHAPDATHRSDSSHHEAGTQQPLKDSQINGGAFRMLEQRSGMTEDQLKSLYASSGAKNFGQFASAIVVSKNLNLDQNAVLTGLKTQSLGQTLQSLGVAPERAQDAVKQAEREVKAANKKKNG
jgi:hypothetical protein